MSDIYYIQEYSKQLSLFTRPSGFVSNLAICFNNNEIVIADSTLYNYSDFFNNAFNINDYSENNWKEILPNEDLKFLIIFEINRYKAQS